MIKELRRSKRKELKLKELKELEIGEESRKKHWIKIKKKIKGAMRRAEEMRKREGGRGW